MGWLILWVVSLVGLVAAGILGLLSFWRLIGGLVWIGTATLLLAWYWLAPTNRFFTFVKEGTVKIVVKGDAVVKILIQWTGYTLDGEGSVVPDGTETGGKVFRESWHPFGGFRYYGFYPIKDIYAYWFKWSGVSEDGKVVHHEKELIDFALLKDDIYWALVDETEDKNQLPLEIELLLTIRITNPYKALFRIQNWLETAINRIKPAVRPVIPAYPYAKWITRKEFLGGQIFEKTEALRKELSRDYGVDLRRVEVKDINPPEKWRQNTIAPYFADLERQATIIKAEGDKKSTILRAEGEEERIEKIFSRINKFGDLGKLVRTLESAEKSPLAASLTVQAIPGLHEMLRGVFGKPAGEITSEELRRLREAIEGLTKQVKK
jgi:hypothetical protein